MNYNKKKKKTEQHNWSSGQGTKVVQVLLLVTFKKTCFSKIEIPEAVSW